MVRQAKHLAVLVTFLSLTACGGSGGGGTTAPSTGTFIKTIDKGSTGTAVMFSDYPTSAHMQYLYLANEVHAAGRLTGISVKYRTNLDVGTSCPNVTITAGHSNLANLTAAFADNVNLGASTTLIDNASVSFPAGTAGSWHTISFTKPFEYNGIDNLILDFKRPTACSGEVPADYVGGWAYNALVASSVDGSEIGTVLDWAANMKFNFEGGDNAVITADGAGANSISIAPSSTGHSQFLILASDIHGSGPITGIQFKPSSALVSSSTATYKVTLSHVAADSTALASTTFTDNVGSNPTVIADGVSVTIPAGTTEWWVPLSGSFNYDGKSNLLIDVEATVTGGFALAYQNVSENRVMTANTFAAATGELLPRGLEPKLRFNGGPVYVMPVGSNSSDWFASTSTAVKRQYLYYAHELGSAGTISKVACRRVEAGTAFSENTFPGFEMVLGHTTENVLSSTYYANNMTDATIVYNGTLNIGPNQGGDWIEVNLTTPFVYDGKRNLVVQWSVPQNVTGGSYACNLVTHTDPNELRRLGSVSATDTTGYLSAHSSELKLWISK